MKKLSIALFILSYFFLYSSVGAVEKSTPLVGINGLLFVGSEALESEENFLAAADQLVKDGAEHIEVPGGLPFDLKNLGEQLRKKGLQVSVVGALAPDEDPATPDPDISSPVDAEREAGLAAMRDQIDQTALICGDQKIKILGGPFHICWKGTMKDANGEAITGQAQADEKMRRIPILVESLKALGDYAAAKGVRIAVEYLNHWEEDFLVTLRSTNEVVLDKVKHPNIGVLVDFSHTTISGLGWKDYRREVARLGKAGKLFLVHSSAPHRKRVELSHLDWKNLLAPILKIEGLEAPISVETFNMVPPFSTGARMHGAPYADPFEVARTGMAHTREQVKRYSN